MIRIALFGTILLSLLARPLRAEEMKIATVDLRRVLVETEEGKKAQVNLKKEFDRKQKELNEQQEELQKAAEDLNKKRTLLPAETVRQKEAELHDRAMKTQDTYLRLQQELNVKQDEATRPLIDRVQRIIAKIAANENLTIVFDQSMGVVYAKPHLDLTNEVIRRFNAGEEKTSSAAAGKKPAADSKKK